MKRQFSKKTLLIAVSALTLIALAFGLSACADKPSYTIGGVTFDSLSTVVGHDVSWSSVSINGSGPVGNGSTGSSMYRVYNYKSDADRDADAAAYIAYVTGADKLGLSALSQDYAFTNNGADIVVHYGGSYGGKTVNAGVDSGESGKLEIVIIVLK